MRPYDLTADIQRARRELFARSDDLNRELVRLYGVTATSLRARLAALAAAVEREIANVNREIEANEAIVQAAQGNATGIIAAAETSVPSVVYQSARIQSLVRQIEDAVNRLGQRAAGAVASAQADAVGLAVEHAERQILSVTGSFIKLPETQLEILVGNMADGTPLATRFAREGEAAAQTIKDTLFNGTAQGWNGRKIGKAIADRVPTVASYNAEVIGRTEPVRAYRTKTVESFAANSSVVEAWRWTASKSNRTCPLCLALDGTVFPTTRAFSSHPMCRCTPVPVFVNRDFDYGTKGADWFASKDESVRREIIAGKAATSKLWEMMQRGDVDLYDLVDMKQTAYGWQPRQRTLRELQDDASHGTSYERMKQRIGV